MKNKESIKKLIKVCKNLNKVGFILEGTHLFNFNSSMILEDDLEDDERLPILRLQFKNLNDSQLEELDTFKFELLKELEMILCRTYSEQTNNDACSFTYNFNTNHAGSNPYLQIHISDFLS